MAENADLLQPCTAHKVLCSDETVAWLNEHYENNQMMIDVFFPFC